MSEELLKQDPLAKPKKITVGICVVVMSVVMAGTFASMHWILSDYFHFKANESEVRSRLDADRARCEDEEKNSKRRIADAEKMAKQRVEALDLEYAEKRKAKEQEFDDLSKTLKAGFEKQKADFALLLKGYMERFVAKTNDFEKAIVEKRRELNELSHKISLLPDLSAQCVAASNELVLARLDRDDANKAKLKAQEEYSSWQVKAGKAKAEAEQWSAKKTAVAGALADLVSQTNTAVVAMAGIEATKRGLESQIVQKRAELEGVNSEVKAARANVSSINDEIKGIELRRNKAKSDCAVAEKERDNALEAKRAAESSRDKAVAERQQAEQNRDAAGKAYEKRKLEVDGLIKGLDEVLKLKSQQVQSAAQVQKVVEGSVNGGDNK